MTITAHDNTVGLEAELRATPPAHNTPRRAPKKRRTKKTTHDGSQHSPEPPAAHLAATPVNPSHEQPDLPPVPLPVPHPPPDPPGPLPPAAHTPTPPAGHNDPTPPATAPDVDDHTIMAADLNTHDHNPLATIVFDTGHSFTVPPHGIVIGRKPTPPGAQHVIPIDDPTKQISKTHLLITATQAGITITDLGSSNGTQIDWRNHHIEALPHLGYTIDDEAVITIAGVTALRVAHTK
ncbi:Forkhead associated (FHA) domain, binds pSer, pThr, pTyr [Micrococcales bacterium KH10]|nr:Forkhead associated (FHA) domain, binds pSer, pThr, pTyr [Micrococcales bacterium KH10]